MTVKTMNGREAKEQKDREKQLAETELINIAENKPLDWMSDNEKVRLLQFYLKNRFYLSARFLADVLPSHLVSQSACDYFDRLSRDTYRGDRIELSHLFIGYHWHCWLNPDERSEFEEQCKKFKRQAI